MAFDLNYLQALHDEIEADPEGLGYKEAGGAWKLDWVIADAINAVGYSVDRETVLMEQVRALVTYDAYNTLSIDEQEWLRWMTPDSGDGADFVVTADMKLQLTGRVLTVDGVAGPGNNSNSFWAAAHRNDMAPAMLALIEVPGSRAEVLWGQGIAITAGHVGHAANL